MSHPKGTKLLADPMIAIEDVGSGSEITCVDIKHQKLLQAKASLSSRHYIGPLYEIRVHGKKTQASFAHQYTVRFSKAAKKIYITYLMRKDSWWRIGVSRAYDSKGFGLKTRMRHEDADEAWALGVYPNKLEAICAEQVLSCKWGIPQTHWNADRSIIESPHLNRTHSHIESIYKDLCLDEMQEAAYSLLRFYGRNASTPLIVKGKRSTPFSSVFTTRIHACNLLSKIMDLPIYNKKKVLQWHPIDQVKVREYCGELYSLSAKSKHYVADGVVTRL